MENHTMVSLLLITHGNLGEKLLQTAYSIMGKKVMPAQALEVGHFPDIEKLTLKAEALIRKLDRGDGVMVLTDLYGATPHNITMRLSHLPITTISGLNLSMLLKVLNHHQASLIELADKAQQGGHVGITCTTPQANQLSKPQHAH